MQCTPWISAKVTVQRDVVSVSVIQRVIALGLCLVFWKTLLPLSIGFAVWYQIRESRNMQIQKEIEHIEKSPELLGEAAILPETRHFLAERGKLPEEQQCRYLPLSNPSLDNNETLRRIFSELSKERQLAIAQISESNLMWALELDASFASGLNFNPFDRDDAIAACAFENLSIEDFVTLVATSNIPNECLENPESFLVHAISECKETERLQAFAGKYPIETVRIIPEEKWDLLGESVSLRRAKDRVKRDVNMLRMNVLKAGLTEGPVSIEEQDAHLIESLYSACTVEQKQYLLESIQEIPAALNKLPVSYGGDTFDFSFVADAWFQEVFPRLNKFVRQAILFSRDEKWHYLNRERICKHAPLESWREYACIHKPVTPRGESEDSPRYLLRCIAQSTSYENELLMRELTLEQFQKIFTGQAEDISRVVEVVSHQPDKVRWLIEQYKLDPKQSAELLFSYKVPGGVILEIAKGLTCKKELFEAFYLKSPIPEILRELRDLDGPRALIPEEKTTAVPGKSGILAHVRGLGREVRQDYYQRLIDPTTAIEAVKELESKASGLQSRQAGNVLKQAFKNGVAIATDAAINRLSNGSTEFGRDSAGALVAGLLFNGSTHTSASAMIDLLLSTCAPDEIKDLCNLSPAPVLRYLALTSKQDFSELINEESVKKLGATCTQIAEVFRQKSKHVELVALAQYRPMDHLLNSFLERESIYNKLSTEDFKRVAQHISLDEVRLICYTSKDTLIQALFEERPVDCLQVGGTSIAKKVQESRVWRELPLATRLSCVSLKAILNDPFTKEQLQDVLSTCCDNPPREILNILKTKEHISWAIAVLTPKAASTLILSKIQPTAIELLRSRIGKDGEPLETKHLREEILEAYAHLLPQEAISLSLLCNKPNRALFALKNRNLSQEQRNAFISAGAKSLDVIHAIYKSRDDVVAYLEHINTTSHDHLWSAVERFKDDPTLLAQIGMFNSPKNFPMPRGPLQWHCALQVGLFKENLVELINGWKSSDPSAYEGQRQQIDTEDLKILQATLKKSGSYYGNRFARTDFGVTSTPRIAAPMSVQRVAAVASPSFPSPGTPIASIKAPWDPETPGTVVRTVKAPRTITRLRNVQLPLSSPLRQLADARICPSRVKPMGDLSTQAEKLAKKITSGQMTFDEALRQHPTFLGELNKRSDEEFTDTFDPGDDLDPYYLGELCLSTHVSAEQVKKILAARPDESSEIQAFLGKPENQLPPDHPKLRLFGRASVMRSPPHASGGFRGSLDS